MHKISSFLTFQRCCCGNGNLWEFIRKTHRFLYGMGMEMTLRLWEFPHVGICRIMWDSMRFLVGVSVGILTEILWEWDGMGIEIPFLRQPYFWNIILSAQMICKLFSNSDQLSLRSNFSIKCKLCPE